MIPAGTPVITVRARIWLVGDEVGERDSAPRLWLHLTDGRVLAFRLPDAALGDDRVLAPLAEALREDGRGLMNGFTLPEVGFVQILYAAPVLPLPQPGPWRCGMLTRGDFLVFARDLDTETLDFLGALGRNDFYASVRNYNRIAALPAEQRERRLQALRRFPALVTPILLTAHRGPNLFDGKRHAWRQPDPAVEAAIHAGRDLTGALAHHYGISKGLVRAPMNAALWEMDYPQRRSCLVMFDVLPANKHPASADEIDRFRGELQSYLYLVFEEGAPEAFQRSDLATHVAAFRRGWTRTWELCRQRFTPTHHALVDSRDFLAAAGARAALLRGTQRAPSPRKLAAAWLATHGLTGLLAASARWHRMQPQVGPRDARFVLPALLGAWQEDGHAARELLTAQALAEEGAAMHHCVGVYWDKCVDGDRIFALRLANGERATARFVPRYIGENDVRYTLKELRGPANVEVDSAMGFLAERLATLINAADREAARRAALTASRVLKQQRQAPDRSTVWLDTTSEQQLHQVLSWLTQVPERAEILLVADVAGYGYHEGPELEASFERNQPLTLAREPDNPYPKFSHPNKSSLFFRKLRTKNPA